MAEETEPAGPKPGPGHPEEAPQGPPPDTGSNVEKNPDDWATGGEPMTGAQASYLKKLCEKAGESFDTNLTKAAASKRIDELQKRGR